MEEQAALFESIAERIADYREGEIAKPTPAHVERWVGQFAEDSRHELLAGLDRILGKTYISRSTFKTFLENLVQNEKICGTDCKGFWRKANLLDIQQHGSSQHDILCILDEVLREKYSLGVQESGHENSSFFYLDDAMFSGDRVLQDLRSWVIQSAPQEAEVHVVVIAIHTLGEWQIKTKLNELAQFRKKSLNFTFWRAVSLENRKAYNANADVFWPAVLPADKAVEEYVESEKRFPFVPRPVGGKTELELFSSEDARQHIESRLLSAGVWIRSQCASPNRRMRPLGYSSYGLGFGSPLVTYRNCPNNCPLALWWGDPSKPPSHSLSKWYPLFPRKTYESIS